MTRAALDIWANEVSRLVQRPIGICTALDMTRHPMPGVLHTRPETNRLPRGGDDLLIVQRCNVCRGDLEPILIGPKINMLAGPPAWAIKIRYEYMIHECPEPTERMFDFNHKDLSELEQAMERDLVRIGDRLNAIRALARR